MNQEKNGWIANFYMHAHEVGNFDDLSEQDSLFLIERKMQPQVTRSMWVEVE
jgi:hypothetical protein